MKFFTLGVYGTTEDSFFKKLTDNNIDTFCDIRHRRGVRGSKYTYANSQKLQNKLYELGIRYDYETGLTPTLAIIGLQLQDDKAHHVTIRSREKVCDAFKKAYEDKILANFDFDSFIAKLKNEGAKNIVLFCVESEACACHRSLVEEELNKRGFSSTDL